MTQEGYDAMLALDATYAQRIAAAQRAAIAKVYGPQMLGHLLRPGENEMPADEFALRELEPDVEAYPSGGSWLRNGDVVLPKNGHHRAHSWETLTNAALGEQ